jgi:hypothetical protein
MNSFTAFCPAGIIDPKKYFSGIISKKGATLLDRMFRVLGFFTLAIGLMAFAGDLTEMALLFFLQTAFFVVLGYMKFTEKTYLLLFWGYMILTFTGFSYWTIFQMGLPL